MGNTDFDAWMDKNHPDATREEWGDLFAQYLREHFGWEGEHHRFEEVPD